MYQNCNGDTFRFTAHNRMHARSHASFAQFSFIHFDLPACYHLSQPTYTHIIIQLFPYGFFCFVLFHFSICPFFTRLLLLTMDFAPIMCGNLCNATNNNEEKKKQFDLDASASLSLMCMCVSLKSFYNL